MGTFQSVAPEQLAGNVFHRIGKEWMLITAQKGDAVNTMTASWGGMGILWGKPVVFAFIRPQRYTKEFMDAADTFSLTFFDESYREQLNLCGAKSGRDLNKIETCGFTVEYGEDTPYFSQANTALLCRKLYVSKLEEASFLDPAIYESMYPGKDYHHVYIGEITKALVK